MPPTNCYGESPIGKHLDILGHKQPYVLVGIVGDTGHRIAEPLQPIMYFPLFNDERGCATIAIRANANESSLALSVQQMDSELAVSDLLTLSQITSKSTLTKSFDAALVLAFAVLSLLLAAVSLFGVLSHIAAGRTSEIGIRIVLGAQRAECRWISMGSRAELCSSSIVSPSTIDRNRNRCRGFDDLGRRRPRDLPRRGGALETAIAPAQSFADNSDRRWDAKNP